MNNLSQRSFRIIFLTALASGFVLVGEAGTQQPPRPGPGTMPPPRPAAKPAPRLEPVAETKLLMEGLNQPNFRALEKLLAKRPADDEAWGFARGQSLLIAETANLLMIRPPRNNGQEAWMERSMAMRDAASALARNLAKKDFETSRKGLVDLAGMCNRCHKTFRAPVKIAPFEEAGDGKDVKADRPTDLSTP
jgi:hypothetical protein